MQIQTFLQHFGIEENPFSAEEARDDPIFQRLLEEGTAHPDFDKVFGDPQQPRAAVVFGEKGSGKTALRLMIERKLERFNADRVEGRAWIVRYDDLNPVLDRFAHHLDRDLSDLQVLQRFRLFDHQDAILSQVVTKLVDRLLDSDGRKGSDDTAERLTLRRARKLPRQTRIDLVELALLYDQPASGSFLDRWMKLRRALRIGLVPWPAVGRWAGAGLAIAAAVMALVLWFAGSADPGLITINGALAAGAVLLLGAAGMRWVRLWRLARRIRKEVLVVDRQTAQVRQALDRMPGRELAEQPIPLPGDHDARYQLTGRLQAVLEPLGYGSLIVLVDRVDEPVMIAGEPERMKEVVWPMLNNKFLQQGRVGLKLLLPIELRHLLRKEDSPFFQQARLDKQHLVDRLSWPGPLLYDLCSRRLQACQRGEAEPIGLKSLFAEDVTERDIIDALDQMHQPRDAFKFLYQVVHEHCASVPEDEPVWRIPRLTLETVRKQQSQRVQDLYRGLAPS